ncbi:hypothetical protein NM680_19575, partial [Paracoccus sp. PS-1]|nr:hypothetical protein [Paracoccus sp. PS1]
ETPAQAPSAPEMTPPEAGPADLPDPAAEAPIPVPPPGKVVVPSLDRAPERALPAAAPTAAGTPEPPAAAAPAEPGPEEEAAAPPSAAGSGFDLSTPPDFGGLRLTD